MHDCLNIAPQTLQTDVAVVRHRLVRDVSRALASTVAAPRIVRVVVSVPDVAPLEWLSRNHDRHRFYWRDRDGKRTSAALGAVPLPLVGRTPADMLDAARAYLEVADPDVRFFGGACFDPATSPDDGWADFAPAALFLPRFELVAEEEGVSLACNLFLPGDGGRAPSIVAAIQHLDFDGLNVVDELPVPETRLDTPEESGWNENIARALEAFRQGSLEKIVLARKATFTFGETVDAFALLARLEEATPGCFHFLVGSGKTTFLGASPERLFRREGSIVYSEAVAGTRPRGTSRSDDARLGAELLNSDKDVREHGYVRRSIAESLRPLCEMVTVDTHPAEMRLARGRHLRSGIRGNLRNGFGDADLMRALHPTPAVGGYPTPEAVALIRQLEGFDRGWYAGPIGWVSRDRSEFAVGIRSGLVEGNVLSLFSGAGIVAGSDPAAEWEEIETKISDFMDVLGMEVQCS